MSLYRFNWRICLHQQTKVNKQKSANETAIIEEVTPINLAFTSYFPSTPPTPTPSIGENVHDEDDDDSDESANDSPTIVMLRSTGSKKQLPEIEQMVTWARTTNAPITNTSKTQKRKPQKGKVSQTNNKVDIAEPAEKR